MTGQRLGPYEVLGKLGEGGMGEVYRARDTVLNRDVAIKMLPAPLALDPDRMARLRREAQLLASLNHPNIAQIHGLEQAGETLALVMELVDGPTLADLVARGPMPLDDVLPIARQVTDALIAAHEQGIIHRDLKPANIKVRTDGAVKVLDFGLAKSVGDDLADSASRASSVTASPTITSPAMTRLRQGYGEAGTMAGVILGTAAYMSPEQAKGRPADKRSDVWAFGCIVYEMLTGKRAFAGDDVGDTLAAVIRGEPDWTALPADLPRPLRAFIQACLEKDRGRRIGHISTARFVLDERTIPPSDGAPVPRRRPSAWRRLVPFVATAVVIAAATSAVWLWLRQPASPAPVVARFQFVLPDDQQLTDAGTRLLAVSRDGSQLVYVANRRLYHRSMSEVDSRPIAGSEITQGFIGSPVFSPDGQSIAFWTGLTPTAGAVKRIAVTGGPPVTICEAGFPYGMSWYDDAILFAQLGRGIMRVADNGGEPHVLVPVKDGQAWGPQMLPAGDAVLFTLATKLTGLTGATRETWDKASLVVHSLRTGERTTLPQHGTGVTYVPTGHLVYAVGGTLFAVPFDVSNVQTGSPVAVIEGVQRPSFGDTTPGTVNYDVSQTGSLVYVPAPSSPQSDLLAVDRNGSSEILKLRRGEHRFPRASPDGTHVAMEVGSSTESNIWIYDMTGATEPRQLTFGGRNRFPAWSHDGTRVLFQSDRDGDLAVFWQRADGGGAPERLTEPDKGTSYVPYSSSADGGVILLDALHIVSTPPTHSLAVLSLKDRSLNTFGDVRASRVSTMPDFSRDGRWVAYTFGSLESATVAVYVQPFPATGEKHLVESRAFFPMWSPSRDELLFVQGGGGFQAAAITANPSFTVKNPTPVSFSRQIRGNVLEERSVDVMPDGERLISVVPRSEPGAAAGPQIHIVLNWFEELKRRAPAP